jgi:hypothetical protein
MGKGLLLIAAHRRNGCLPWRPQLLARHRFHSSVLPCANQFDNVSSTLFDCEAIKDAVIGGLDSGTVAQEQA